MALVSMKEMLITAKKQGYAVGQFNINNLEWTQAILQAAQEENSPVILGVSEGAAKYMGSFVTVVHIVKGLIESYNITVPVAIHLDHGSSFAKCKEAIDAGFTSVMIDASHHSYDENVNITKEVVEYAHARNVSVEAELGTVGGEEDGVIGMFERKWMDIAVPAPHKQMKMARRLSFNPPDRKIEKKPGPTWRPMLYTKSMSPNSFMK